VLVFDTNVLVYAVDEDSPFHDGCRDLVSRARSNRAQSFVTWSICYEFLRVTTHAKAPISPWSLPSAVAYLDALLSSPGFQVLTATPSRAAVLAQTASEHPNARGNLAHDLHTAVIMREHSVSRICTRDTDSRRFPFLDVVDPLSASLGD